MEHFTFDEAWVFIWDSYYWDTWGGLVYLGPEEYL